MKKLFSTSLVFAFFVCMPMVAMAQLSGQDTGLSTTVQTGYGQSGDIASLPEFIGQYIILPAVSLSATIIFVLFIYAGFLWMTAQGKQDQVKKAQDILRNAVIGAVLIVSAYVIVNFVVTQLGGV